MVRMTDRDPLLVDEEDLAFQEAQRLRQEEIKAKQAPAPQGKGDLVLRLALMKIGVVTEAMLDDVERRVAEAKDKGAVLVLEPIEGGMDWRLLSMEELRQALGSAVVSP